MAHGLRAAIKANNYKDYNSRRYPGYPVKGKISKRFTHRKERHDGKRNLSSNLVER